MRSSSDGFSGIGSATITGDTLTWTGELGAVGDYAEVSYTVTYQATGDHVLDNTACVPANEAQNQAAACDTVSVPGSGLVHLTSVDRPRAARSRWIRYSPTR